LESLTPQDLKIVKQKLMLIQKEKTELVCSAIKFSTKLMTKNLNTIVFLANNTASTSLMDILTRVKLFLKITRLVIETAKTEISNSEGGNQIEFFRMISAFTEKVQARLYIISNDLINTLLRSSNIKPEIPVCAGIIKNPVSS
jgi:hypothetical protein